MEPISCWIPSFKSSRDRGRCLKTFSFRYPQRKTSHGLKSGDRAGHSTSPLRDQTPREQQQQSPGVHRSKPLWVLTTVEANQPHDTNLTSLAPLQPAQCPFEKWEIFMPHPVSPQLSKGLIPFHSKRALVWRFRVTRYNKP